VRKQIWLLALVAAGCVPTPQLRSEHAFTNTIRRAPWSGDVKVLLDGQPLAGEYEEVAIVNATGSSSDANLPAIIGALQDEARDLGCNAVIRVRYDRGVNNASATGVAVWMK
jgi:hypothetical protein